ncbi:hypothetical protein [Chitinophaga sancti]|uniref:Uncharacterized protein n=1 Tax=Chitinophaga sancti TaxID=1004 RepID=A0A1K1LME5_9BACT|nr:hypothetical protein [Chitinophaga sancti]WQD65021.1 hypothetical protein U0033_11500 [Chitinophaga sancti]WQG89355.1 hypothetical protein SR876_30970 [Chitinophaga sancti]SFW12072.1 hypothetical protein SAMN05661012_00040 [Chitinophaga sancti]
MKTKLLLAVLVLGFLVSGCKKEYITQEIPNITIQGSVASNTWQYDNTTKTYYRTISVPQITDATNQTDGVLVYISGDGKTWEALPDVYNGSSIVYTYTTGSLTLEIQGADGSTVNPPGNLYVKIVLVASA